MANNQNQNQKGPKGDFLITFEPEGKGKRFYITAFKGSEPLKDLLIAVKVQGQLHGGHNLKTNDNGQAEWVYIPAAGDSPTPEFTFEAIAPTGKITQKVTPRGATDPAAKPQTKAPKFICEAINIGPGEYRLQMSLMNPDTEASVEGDVRLSYPHEFWLDGVKTPPRKVAEVHIGVQGEIKIFKILKPGRHLIDGSIPLWPNEDADFEVEGPTLRPVTADPASANYWEILLRDCM
jgi:hypothetical protein